MCGYTSRIQGTVTHSFIRNVCSCAFGIPSVALYVRELVAGTLSDNRHDLHEVKQVPERRTRQELVGESLLGWVFF